MVSYKQLVTLKTPASHRQLHCEIGGLDERIEEIKHKMSTWDPENDVVLTDSEDEFAVKRDFHGREAILFVVDANLQVQTL